MLWYVYFVRGLQLKSHHIVAVPPPCHRVVAIYLFYVQLEARPDGDSAMVSLQLPVPTSWRFQNSLLIYISKSNNCISYKHPCYIYYRKNVMTHCRFYHINNRIYKFDADRPVSVFGSLPMLNCKTTLQMRIMPEESCCYCGGLLSGNTLKSLIFVNFSFAKELL